MRQTKDEFMTGLRNRKAHIDRSRAPVKPDPLIALDDLPEPSDEELAEIEAAK